MYHRQWRIQDFPEVGALTPKHLLFCKLFAKNCMKMKIFTTVGVPCGPVDPPMTGKIYTTNDSRIYLGQTPQNLKLNFFLPKFSETSTTLSLPTRTDLRYASTSLVCRLPQSYQKCFLSHILQVSVLHFCFSDLLYIYVWIKIIFRGIRVILFFFSCPG